MFYIEIEIFKKKCINRLILTAVFSTLIIILLLANITEAGNMKRGILFMGIITTAAVYFGVIFNVISSYSDKFVELTKKYTW